MRNPLTISQPGTGLLVVDMQEKFSPVIPEFERLAHNIAKLVLTFQMYRMPVMVSEQYPKGLGKTVEKIRRQFTPFDPIEKIEFACTECASFGQRLTGLGLQTLVVVGVETHVCINQTVLGLLQQGYRVHVVADAVGARHALDHDIALRKMEMAGACPTTTEMALFEIARQAGTQQFKYIQQMVKATASTLSGAQTGGERQDGVGPDRTATAIHAGESRPVPRSGSSDEPAVTVGDEYMEELSADELPEVVEEELAVDLETLGMEDVAAEGKALNLDTKKIRMEFSGEQTGESSGK